MHLDPLEWLGLATGCALGGILRVWIAGLIGARGDRLIPWNTLAVNASGALLLGMLAGLIGTGPGGSLWWPLGVGLLGSYTTVSSFSLQTMLLLRAGNRAAALANVALSLGLCLVLAAVGLTLGGWVGR